MMERRLSESESRAHWYAVSTKSRQEKAAANTLQALGVRHFLPLRLQNRQWSDRVQAVSVPLFPGYLFVHVDLWSPVKLEVLKVPGIARFIGDRMGPSPIPVSEIESIQGLMNSGVEFDSHPFLKEGDRVRVVRGALAGIEGILVRVGSRSRMVISIEIIHRSLAITVSERDVELLTAMPEKVREIA
jgi:transcription termination/antitermination protein NusG